MMNNFKSYREPLSRFFYTSRRVKSPCNEPVKETKNGKKNRHGIYLAPCVYPLSHTEGWAP